MASVDVKTDVQAPDTITIHLVREDMLDTSHIFRVLFEITLAILGSLSGVILSGLTNENDIGVIYYVFLLVMLVFCIAFLVLSIKQYNKAKSKSTAIPNNS